MLWDASALHGYSLDASDGRLGTVSDLLFSDDSWRVRWLVVDTGNWLSERKVLLHPSALEQPEPALRQFPVNLTKRQVEDSPDIATDQPVSRQMESHLTDYYGWNPYWGDPYFGMDVTATRFATPSSLASLAGSRSSQPGAADTQPDGDPHLRSSRAVNGYHIHASDGAIGHVRDLLVDDISWDIRYIVVETRNWWPGENVLISPRAVRDLDWVGKIMTLDVTRQQIKDSPRYDPTKTVDRAYDEQLQAYYGWPGYGL